MAKKIIKYIIVFFVQCILFLAYLLCWPQLLFSHKVEYRNFSIYSNDEIDNRIQPIIDTSIKCLKTSEIYDSTIHQRLFLIQNSFYYTLTQAYSRSRAGFHQFLFNNSMIVPAIDLDKGTMLFADDHIQKLYQTIVHETIHSMQENKLGFLKIMALPRWKQEGYAFYIAKNSRIMKNGMLRKYLPAKVRKLLYKWKQPEEYWCFAIMVAFAITEKHMSFEQICNSEVKEDEMKTEVINRFMLKLFQKHHS